MEEFKVDFFIAGAPKCATSSLAHYLSQHPHVCFSTPKEPGYFAFNLPESRLAETEKEYSKCFSCSKKHKQLKGEGSTIYLYSSEAFRKIIEHNPEAKIILMLRNPIDLAFSLFLQVKHNGYEEETEFHNAWNFYHERKKGTTGKSVTLYKDVVSLGSQVKALFSIVPRNQIFIGFLEDFKPNPAHTYKEILSFLNLSDDNREEYEIINSSGDHRNRLMKCLFMFVTKNRMLYKWAISVVRFLKIPNWLVNKLHKSPIKMTKKELPSEIRKEIASELKSEVETLTGLVGRDLSIIWQDFK